MRRPYRPPPRVWGTHTSYDLHGSGALSGAYFGNAPSPPDAVLDQVDRRLALINSDRFSDIAGGPWYGNYVGPTAPGYYAGDPNAPPPVTPVDRAAWQHDFEYNKIYEAYGFDEAAHPLGWFGNLTSLDPGFQLELAWADLKLIGRSWGYMSEGLFDGFYRSDELAFGKGPLAFGMDLAWAFAITATHARMIASRLTMVGVGVVYHGMRLVTGGIMELGDWIGGDVGRFVTGIGEFLDGLVVGFGQLAGLVIGAAGALSIISAGVVALAAALPNVFVGSIVGGLVDTVGDFFESVGDGCFITHAVLQSESLESDDGAILSQLRGFRDEYVLTQPGGRGLINTYYATAPEIVRVIDARPDRQQIWRNVYQRWLHPAVEAVRRGHPRRALELYEQMLTTLCAVTGVPKTRDSSRRHWKRDPMLAA
ncbi:MAG: hypothetical protein OXN89_03265 [Bryobacterales bacterium]|nr:hypothetical protein [Bryobacterales bacterium]